MPICTSCTHPLQYLYTVYDSADNLRLEQCPACYAFADPYVEHDTLTLWIDLVLLKRDVYRHLLFNRGTGARKIGTSIKSSGRRKEREDDAAELSSPSDRGSGKERERLLHILKLGLTLVAIDAFIRWTHLSSNRSLYTSETDTRTWNHEAVEGYLRILVGCLIETAGFHAGVILSSFLVLRSVARFREKPSRKAREQSGILSEFRYSHIPLSLLYSSLNKLFLLLMLAIWRPTTSPEAVELPSPVYNIGHFLKNPKLLSILEILDDDKLDREWVLRNILGGMAAGFGLRVVLDCHPVLTTLVILPAGWAVKTALANLVSRWVNAGLQVGNQTASEMWLAYSIP